MIAFFTSCNTNQGNTDIDENKITVVTTVFPVYDWTRNVAGDRCNIIYLDESGTDMHSYTPTSATLDALSQADVFIYVGGESDEKWVDRAISASGNGDLITLCGQMAGIPHQLF